MEFHANYELLLANRVVIPMKTNCTAAKLAEVSIVEFCVLEMELEQSTYVALAAKISAGFAGVDNAKATEKTKESPVAVKIRPGLVISATDKKLFPRILELSS
jgi:hypothetical protein